MFSANLQNIAALYQLSQSGQVRVAVAANQAMFSNFSYIDGVVTAGADGASVQELHTINQMIEHLHRQHELKQAASKKTELVRNRGTILDIEV